MVATAYRALDRPADARPQIEHALTVLDKPDRNPSVRIEALGAMADLLFAEKRYEEALARYERCVDEAEKVKDGNPLVIARARANAASAKQMAQGTPQDRHDEKAVSAWLAEHTR